MARAQGTGSGSADQNNAELTFQAESATRIDLPNTDFIADAAMTREGDDLILQTPDGDVAVIEGYFAADPAPVLHAPDGSVLTPNLVEAFARSPMEFAANETATDQSPVGAVEEVKGNATVTRADGTVETITNGTPIYQGDIVQTDAEGAVNIVFIDETSMAISANARLAIDQYSYDPSTESGTTNFSVLRGLFVFTSGLIGRDDPDDVKIDTPVGSIGIRGTIIAGEIIPGGESNISVLEGAIVIKNGVSEVTLSEQFETVRLSGFDQPMQDIGVVPASEISTKFSTVSNVNPSLFSMINEAVKEQSVAPAPEAPKTEAAPEPTSSNTNETQQPVNEPQSQAPQTVPTPAIASEQAPAPSMAPDVFTTIDSSVPTLDTSSLTGLPSSQTIAGQPATGLTGSNPVTAPAVTAPSIATAMPAATNAPFTASQSSASPAPVVTEPAQQPPPSVIGTSPTTPTTPTAPTVTFSGGTINDVSAANTVVGQITGTAGAITGYTFTNGTTVSNDGYYQIVGTGANANVVLTSAGAAQLASSLSTIQLGGLTITATYSDGTTTTSNYGVTVVDSNSIVVDFSANPHGVSIISDNFTGGNNLGYSITALGDTNNDGFDDFIASNNSTIAGQNHLYSFQGRTAFLPSGNVTSTVTATPPIPTLSGDTSQTVVAGIGDFNGDGIEDYVVGQYGTDSSVAGSGNALIINGANPANSIRFTTGLTSGADVGYAVSGVGDMNNDGYADVVIGAPGIDSAYFVAGGTTSWTPPITTGNAFGGTAGSEFGRSITGLGDFNGDGYSDYAVGATSDDTGATNGGRVHIYGGNAAMTVGAAIGSVTGSTANQAFGMDISSAGDVNGDGRTDLFVIGNTGASLVFGTDGTASRNVNFEVTSNYTVLGGGGVGDVNGDGFDDFAISLGNATGSKTYVVFGRDFASNVTYDLNFFKDGENAVEIQYAGANNTSKLEISAIGDTNGDGYDDFAIGLPDANGASAGNGGIAVFYGRDTGQVTAGLSATADDQKLVGTAGNDTFYDGNHDGISMRGGAGSDVFRISNTNFLGIDGGGNVGGLGMTGYDRISANGSGTALDFSDIDFEKISGIEGIHFAGDNQTITLTLENLFNLMKTSDDGILRIGRDGVFTDMNFILSDGNGTDNYAGTNNTVAQVTQMLDDYAGGASGAVAGTTTESGNTYNTFRIGGYTLLIDQAVTVDAQ